MQIFKSYDVRGVYPSELNEEIAYKLGRSIVVYLKAKQLIVGRDIRLSSDSLSKALINGIIEQGCDVVNIGLCSTPMLYFASLNLPAVMVTASHLPAEFNGFKICKKGAIALSAETGLKDIEQLIADNKFLEVRRKGKISHKTILDDYIKGISSFGVGIKKLKVVVDSGNGMEALVAPKLLDNFPVQLVPLFFDFDGRYPNRSPNPEFADSLIVLQKKVKAEKADIGVGFDSDCDRVFFVDERGNRVRADHALLLLAKIVGKKGDKIVYASNCSRIVEDELKQMKLKAIKARVGHSLMKKQCEMIMQLSAER